MALPSAPASSRFSGPYTAVAGQTVLNYGFGIEAASEIAVERRRAGAVER